MAIALLTLALVRHRVPARLHRDRLPRCRPRSRALKAHFLLALLSTTLLVMAHSFIMFFLIATGVEMKDMEKERGWGDSFRRRTIKMKGQVFPAMTFALLLVLANFIMGAAAHTRAVPARVHEVLAWLTLLTCVFTLLARVARARRQQPPHRGGGVAPRGHSGRRRRGDAHSPRRRAPARKSHHPQALAAAPRPGARRLHHMSPAEFCRRRHDSLERLYSPSSLGPPRWPDASARREQAAAPPSPTRPHRDDAAPRGQASSPRPTRWRRPPAAARPRAARDRGPDARPRAAPAPRATTPAAGQLRRSGRVDRAPAAEPIDIPADEPRREPSAEPAMAREPDRERLSHPRRDRAAARAGERPLAPRRRRSATP